MKVFLSWSGGKSRAVAAALREWLPYINAEIEPWMSDTDIDPGKRWSGEVAKELQDISFGIVCVTRDNQSARWLNFEAGALAKQVDESRVVPLAIDLKPVEVLQPLGAFNGVEMTRDGLLALLKSLDALCEHQVPDVSKACERNWSALQEKLDAIPASIPEAVVREPQDLLQEILTIVRRLERAAGPVSPLSYLVIGDPPWVGHTQWEAEWADLLRHTTADNRDLLVRLLWQAADRERTRRRSVTEPANTESETTTTDSDPHSAGSQPTEHDADPG